MKVKDYVMLVEKAVGKHFSFDAAPEVAAQHFNENMTKANLVFDPENGSVGQVIYIMKDLGFAKVDFGKLGKRSIPIKILRVTTAPKKVDRIKRDIYVQKPLF
jgi:hypothetical protein